MKMNNKIVEFRNQFMFKNKINYKIKKLYFSLHIKPITNIQYFTFNLTPNCVILLYFYLKKESLTVWGKKIRLKIFNKNSNKKRNALIAFAAMF